MEVMIEDAIYDGDRIWMIPTCFNSLLCRNIITGETELIGKFHGESYSTERLYASMKLIKRKIYFVPFRARNIAVFDIEKNKFTYITIKNIGIINRNTKPLFIGAEKFQDYLFVFPAYGNSILRINTINNEVEYITEWIDQVKELIFNKNDSYFRKQAYIKENKLVIPFCNANAVLELNCYTKQSFVYRLGVWEAGYAGICYDGANFWLTPRTSGDLVKWNLEKREIKIIKLYNEGERNSLNIYAGVLCCDGQILLFPSIDNEQIADKSQEKIVMLEGQYSIAKKEENNFIYYRKDIYELTIIDTFKRKNISIKSSIKRSDFNYYVFLKEKKKIIYETKELSLKRFLVYNEINHLDKNGKGKMEYGYRIFTGGFKI